MTSSESCQQCGHDFDSHALLATNGATVDGGVMLCPVAGCRCFSTWGVDGLPAVRIPDDSELEMLRTQVQTD